MPLNMHANAVPAALAVEAQRKLRIKHVENGGANLQHPERLEEHQERAKPHLTTTQELGLNAEFDKVLLASTPSSPFQRDYGTVKIGVKGTPLLSP